MADTAGHEIAKGEEKHQNRKKSLEALEKAKQQQSSKQGRFVWNAERRAYFLNKIIINNEH